MSKITSASNNIINLMNQTSKIDAAIKIMLDFSSITGLEPASEHPKRYLWTDAFAVCNYLELHNQTNDKGFLNLALKLVDQVHHYLGHYSKNDPRKGWISGLKEVKAEQHPTKGGLRIGKELNERQPGEKFNERMEWDRDGQYYHYLTKWMHALNRVGITVDDPVYSCWALELARAAHHSFTYITPSGKRMYWKMSIDLSHPQVTSMGQQDPLDGYITYNELQQASRTYKKSTGLPNIKLEIEDMTHICRGLSWITEDPLGIGGLLSDSLKIAQLKTKTSTTDEKTDKDCEKLLINMLGSALSGIKYYSQNNPPDFPAVYRLAFREMGLSIGIKGIEYLQKILAANKNLFDHYHILKQNIEALLEYVPLAVSLENFWLDNKNRKSSTWKDHREINMVMLATSLLPCGFLRI